MNKQTQRTPVHEQAPPVLLTEPDVAAALRISVWTLRRLCRTGFPAPIRISPGRVRWLAADVAAWIEQQRAEARARSG